MPTADKLTPESRFMALFVGQKHSGKTSAACSWYNKDSNKMVKVLDGDGRIRGILGAPWIDKSRINYDYYPPRLTDKTKPFFQRVNEDLEALLVQCVFPDGRLKPDCPYETYVADSMTAFTRNLIIDVLGLTGGSKKIGGMSITGPNEYNFEVTGSASYMAMLKSLPINVIVTAHLEDKWEKPRDENNKLMPYADSIVVGEKLALRPKVDAAIGINFDHIFKFSREIESGKEEFYVEFIGDIACTSFPGLPVGKQKITGLNFRDFVLSKVKS